MRVVILLALIILCVINGLTEAGKGNGKEKGKGKKRVEVKAVSSDGSFTKHPKKNGKRVEFNTNEEMTLHIEGKKDKKAKLKKAYGGPENKKFASKKNEQWAVYSDPENGVTCRKDCDDTGSSCDEYCNVDAEDQGCFIMGDKAMCVDNEPGAMPDVIYPEDLPMPEYVFSDETRTRRSVVAPNMTSVGIVRVIFHYDDKYMNTFKVMADGNATEAKNIATKFTKLLANEVTIMYQSLLNYNETFTFNNVSRKLDFAIYVAEIVFPQITDNNFVNVNWSSEALNGSTTVFQKSSLDAFAYFAMDYSTEVEYDLQAAMTGYQFGGSIIGLAYFGSVCDSVRKKEGYTNIINRQTGYMAIVVAHEIGHNFGMSHDGIYDNCSKYTHVMSAPSPGASTIDTYHTFSSCSASMIQKRLDGFTNDDNCLYGSNISDTQFLDQFCLGFRGTGTTLEDTCKFAYGANSTVCGGGENGYATHCLPGSYRCTWTFDGECYDLNLIPFGVKCTTDGTLGDKICYKGSCVSGVELCAVT